MFITISNCLLLNPIPLILFMDIRAVMQELECIAPPDKAEEMDTGRIGLIIEGSVEVDTIACSLDVTPAVIQKAICHGTDLLVAHHTPIWSPVTSVRGPLASLLKEVLKSGLNVYVMHTNFDHAPGGINDALADLLNMKDVCRMALGVCGDCRLDQESLVRRLAAPVLAWGNPTLPGRLAVVGGSGFDLSLIDEAVSLGADFFLSADLKHAVARSSPLPLIETTHYALEAPGMRRLAAERGWLFLDDPPVVTSWI
jgi:dinuclear metal center YbgI/SA1388 family protein